MFTDLGVIMNVLPAYTMVVLIAMMLLGIAIKRTSSIRDEFIPLILMAVAFILILGTGAAGIFQGALFVVIQNVFYALVYAIIIGAVAVGLHQTFIKQLTKIMNGIKK